jgi:hypothetical protein
MSNPETPPPPLAPPGAGLPAYELAIARFLFWWIRRNGSRDIFTQRFERERDIILDLVCQCPEGAAGRRVLIKRLRGIEDSSRYWSVWMTLDHLRIVNLAVASAIRALGHGTVPDETASTAAVKPDPAVDASVVEGFKRSCETFLQQAAKVPDLKTALRYHHPWFGPLDAEGWYALGGVHLGLHRHQIERIIAGL